MAIGTAIAIISGIALAAKAIGGLFSGIGGGGGSVSYPAPPSLPKPPSPQKADEAAEQSARKRKSALTKTVYSNPLGLGSQNQAQIARKTLLGQ